MSVGVTRIGLLLAGCLVGLTACETNSINTGSFPNPFRTTPDSEATGSIGQAWPTEDKVKPQRLMPSDPNDDLSLGKENFREGNYGLAERYFRKAVESGPKDAEAWLGLAAAYDRLRRFELADRAYEEVIKIAGPTPEILNNQGYSYMLRGKFDRAREILMTARAKDPGNPYVQNNLALLDESVRTRKAVR
jgi:tetratricopeptide (TPR) repeat protein